MRRDLTPFRKNSSLLPSDFLKNFFGSDFVDDFFNNTLLSHTPSYIRTDIKETEKEYILEADLPGFKKENINVEYHDEVLTVSAKKNDEIKEEKDSYVRRERNYGEISRSFHVDNIREEEIKGEYKNGVLRIILPKAESSIQKKKTIDIN